MDTGEDKPDSDIEYAGITVYDEYRTEQAEWLRRVLDSKEYKDAPFKIIVAHIPPIGGWHGNLEVEQKFMPLLRDAKPDVMLCGHLHRFIHQDATGSYTVPDYRQFQYGYFESGCRSERTKNTGRRCGRESGGSILHKEALKNDK